MQTERKYHLVIQNMFESRILAGAPENVPGGKSLTQKKTVAWSFDMEVMKKCVERCRQLANKKTEQLFQVSIPCLGRVGNGWRIVQSVFFKCVEMLVFGQSW